MDKVQIQTAIKNLDMAKVLTSLAFEQLKNLKEFRESVHGSFDNRKLILGMLQEAINQAKKELPND